MKRGYNTEKELRFNTADDYELDYKIHLSIHSKYPENLRKEEKEIDDIIDRMTDIKYEPCRFGDPQLRTLTINEVRSEWYYNEFKENFLKDLNALEALKLSMRLDRELGFFNSKPGNTISSELGLFFRINKDIFTANDLKKAALEKLIWMRDHGHDMSRYHKIEKKLGGNEMDFHTIPSKHCPEKSFNLFQHDTIEKLKKNEELSVHECIWICSDASDKDFEDALTYINDDELYEDKEIFKEFLRMIRIRYRNHPNKVYRMRAGRLLKDE